VESYSIYWANLVFIDSFIVLWFDSSRYSSRQALESHLTNDLLIDLFFLLGVQCVHVYHIVRKYWVKVLSAIITWLARVKLAPIFGNYWISNRKIDIQFIVMIKIVMAA